MSFNDWPYETLGQRQELHAVLISVHILWLVEQGYRVRKGDAFRDPRVHGYYGHNGPDDQGVAYGADDSYHKLKLADDLNLMRDGRLLTTTEEHRESGEKWLSRHDGCTWGGHWSDGNHYSMFEGRWKTKGSF